MYKTELNVHYNDYDYFFRIMEHVQQNVVRIWSSIFI